MGTRVVKVPPAPEAVAPEVRNGKIVRDWEALGESLSVAQQSWFDDLLERFDFTLESARDEFGWDRTPWKLLDKLKLRADREDLVVRSATGITSGQRNYISSFKAEALAIAKVSDDASVVKRMTNIVAQIDTVLDDLMVSEATASRLLDGLTHSGIELSANVRALAEDALTADDTEAEVWGQ